MMWKEIHLQVELSHTLYQKGVSLSKAAMRFDSATNPLTCEE